MLKLKTGICIDCPSGSPAKTLKAGRCQFHYKQHRFKISQDRIKKRNPNLQKEQDDLGKWFQHHNTHNNWICENCGTILNPFCPEATSSCQAHILPKSIFKSVKSVLANHMTLGGLWQPCKCHADFDSSWERAEGMQVFTLAKERFLTFKHLIHPSEYKSLPDPFYKLIYAH